MCMLIKRASEKGLELFSPGTHKIPHRIGLTYVVYGSFWVLKKSPTRTYVYS